MRHYIQVIVLLIGAFFVQSSNAQNVSTIFDDGVLGDSVSPIGDPPMYHHREHVVYGPASSQSLTSVYDNFDTIRVLPSTVWNGVDIVPIRSTTNLQLDFWFGDPFDGGERSSYDISTDGSFDLKADNPMPGYRFIPERFFAVKNRLVAYCGVWQESILARSKIGILSASLTDIQQGVEDPWTVHYVTGSYSNTALHVGTAWAISTPVFYEGAYWSVVNDYESITKEGGQCWLLKMGADGMPIGMVRLYMRNNSAHEHWHGGGIIFDGSSYKAVWHQGDGDRRLFFREISSLSEFDTNASTDPTSGINSLYKTSLASDLDWGQVVVAAGPNEHTAIVNSRWKNAFILCQDPNDESKLLYGSDISSGLVERLEIDQYGTAVCETVFNPISRYKRMADREATMQLYMFYVSQNGMSMVGMVKNELRLGQNSRELSGLILSEDGGQTWGWVWKGQSAAGVALLSNGRIIVGSDVLTTTLQGVMPGSKIVGKPLFVGYRPDNLIGTAADQILIGDGNGDAIAVGSSPEKSTPPIVHSEEVFDITRTEDGTSSVVIELINEGIVQEELESSNLQVALWIRRKTPTSNSEPDRMQMDNMIGLESPGADFGAPTDDYITVPQLSSSDWTRIVSSYKGSNLTGKFNTNPGDLRVRVKGSGLGISAGNIELLFESININHDRPPLPYQAISDSGISSAKIDGLGLGESWSVMAVMQIPEECWDSWTGNQSNRWEEKAPMLTIADADDTNYVSVEANMHRTSYGGSVTSIVLPKFYWEVLDSESAEPTQTEDIPLHTIPVVVAISKDGAGDLNYVIAGAHGSTKIIRPMSAVINADSIRFSDIFETDALEMYIHKVMASPIAYSARDLEGFISSLSLPVPPCPADLNHDGQVNFFDVSAFLSAFSSMDPIADFTDDGSFNFFDVSAFLLVYSKGCP